MPTKNEIIVFDANFFICMNSIRVKNILENLHQAGLDLGFNYYISAVVFDEIKASNTFREKFQKIVKIEKIENSQIETIKNDLSQQGIRFPAQDPDLSLLCLSQKLRKEDNNSSINLVSDDFKLVKNANLFFHGKINILSLSSFLLKIHRTISNKQLRSYFKNTWKKSLNYTLSYMIERSKIYPAEEKITWLIEKAISVTQDSIVTQDAHDVDSQKEPVKFEIGTSKYDQEITICEKYIENQKLANSEEELVSGIINFLENLKISREYLIQARKAIEKHDSKNAVKYLKKGNGFLISLLQIASGQLTNLKNYEIVEKLICSEISKMEFLRAFILISLGRVNNAIDSLERAALFSTIIHNHQTCLTLNYVKALILLFHGLYNNAIMAYNFTEELADIYSDERLKLKCAIGKSIALYIQGEEGETAMAIMEEISNMDMEKNFLDAIIVFSELGDYFLALGHSQLAANLYNEALEISIDYKLKIRSDILIEKLKRSYIATVLNGYSTEDIMVDKLDVLLNKAYSVKDVEKYNDQIKKISTFNILFYTPFPYITGKKKIIPYIKLPQELQEDYLEVVHFEKMGVKGVSKYLFIVSHYELGLLGIILKTDEIVTGIAENYTLKFKPTSKVKIYNPSAQLKDTYLIRAIIEVVSKNECEIIYSLPSFFKALNI
ncbi:MAG: tetratricopeptide repeat protein [Candidatus Lokiarchaeota archaeon]|nr:tetratricopeptide repeat protein [Candidatus Lokiarchaeota archaeon]